jgi:hypothetical protein
MVVAVLYEVNGGRYRVASPAAWFRLIPMLVGNGGGTNADATGAGVGVVAATSEL